MRSISRQMLMGFLLLAGLVFPVVSDAKTKNGELCKDPSECESGYCSSNLKEQALTGPFGQSYCMDPGLNCPIPGGPGIRYRGEYNFGGAHWYCVPLDMAAQRGIKPGTNNDGAATGRPDYNDPGPPTTAVENIRDAFKRTCRYICPLVPDAEYKAGCTLLCR